MKAFGVTACLCGPCREYRSRLKPSITATHPSIGYPSPRIAIAQARDSFLRLSASPT
jgi:hypothetical protein